MQMEYAECASEQLSVRTDRFSGPVDVFEELRRMRVVAEVVVSFETTFEFELGVVRAGDDLLRQVHDAFAEEVVARLEDDHVFYEKRSSVDLCGERVDQPGMIRSLTGGFLSSAASSSAKENEWTSKGS